MTINYFIISIINRLKNPIQPQISTKTMKSFPIKDGDFTKSSWSKNNPKTCVEVAMKPQGVAVRNSTDKQKTTVFFTHDEWHAFTAGVKGGEFESKS